MGPSDEAFVRSVAERAGRYYRALRKVQPILREILAGDPTIGTGRSNRDAEEESELGQSYRVSSYDHTVVIGFWCSGERPRFVCSGRGLNLINADRLLKRAIEVGNRPHAKDADAAYENFREVSRNMARIVPDTGIDRLQRLIRACFRDEPKARAFSITEAEARMIAFLMQNKLVSGEVHLYGTEAPCSDCCQAFARLGPLRTMYQRIQDNPIAHSGPLFQQFRLDYEAAGLDRWKIGGLYFGRYYDGEKATDLGLLNRAVHDGSIGWVKQITLKQGG